MSDTPETDAAWAVESGNGLNEVKEISRKLERERDEARAALREIANASHFDNIGNWARNKAKKALEDAK